MRMTIELTYRLFYLIRSKLKKNWSLSAMH